MDMRPPPGVPAMAAQGLNTGAMPAFSYAFQPIVDTASRQVYSYEALVRGPQGEPAYQVLEAVAPTDKYRFDQASRVAAIALAARLHLPCRLNLNLLPQGLFEQEDPLTVTLAIARAHGIAAERLILEVTEGEVIADYANLGRRLNTYRAQGVRFAIDDFGAGYSGLNLLADFQPDQIKIDMNLVRGIERHGPRQAIVRAIAQACEDLGVDVVAEGVETQGEYAWLADQGIQLFQGYYFARPAFEALAEVVLPWAGALAVAPPLPCVEGLSSTA
jgi:blue light- and temperature-responsive anti-repressor